MRILKAGILYFAIVFGAGFVLWIIRALWVVPWVGTRMAELMGTLIMLVVTIVAARWIVRRLSVPPFRFVLWLPGLSLRDYLATRDPVSGTVYYLKLGGTIMPLLAARRCGNPAIRATLGD